MNDCSLPMVEMNSWSVIQFLHLIWKNNLNKNKGLLFGLYKSERHTPPPRKALIGIGPKVVPGTADCTGLYLCADAATGSFIAIVSSIKY